MHHALVVGIFSSIINAMLPLLRLAIWTATRVLLPILPGFTVELCLVRQPAPVDSPMLAYSRR
jgi:hypothetical protein